MSSGGMPDGDYMLGELDVVVTGGVARLRESGNLAASTIKLIDAVRNVIKWGVATEEQTVYMASLGAAKSVGLENKCGSLKKGLDADFIIVNKNYDLQKTYLNGTLQYTSRT
jgi:N-acetylglucosamine-6-phosphate deacetylase